MFDCAPDGDAVNALQRAIETAGQSRDRPVAHCAWLLPRGGTATRGSAVPAPVPAPVPTSSRPHGTMIAVSVQAEALCRTRDGRVMRIVDAGGHDRLVLHAERTPYAVRELVDDGIIA